MDKYKNAAEKRLGNTKSYGNHKIHPEEIARQAHVKGVFAARERDEFFEEVYGDILVDYFLQWLKTEPHETKSREFLYKWFQKFKLWDLKDQYFREYYRSGNIFLYRVDGKFKAGDYAKLINQVLTSQYYVPSLSSFVVIFFDSKLFVTHQKLLLFQKVL